MIDEVTGVTPASARQFVYGHSGLGPGEEKEDRIAARQGSCDRQAAI
jgi:hypothetical protein